MTDGCTRTNDYVTRICRGVFLAGTSQALLRGLAVCGPVRSAKLPCQRVRKGMYLNVSVRTDSERPYNEFFSTERSCPSGWIW